MKQIYTEIRIIHNSLEEKKEFEKALDEALKIGFYPSRVEWVRQKAREEIERVKINSK